jgi:hypothetical protein
MVVMSSNSIAMNATPLCRCSHLLVRSQLSAPTHEESILILPKELRISSILTGKRKQAVNRHYLLTCPLLSFAYIKSKEREKAIQCGSLHEQFGRCLSLRQAKMTQKKTNKRGQTRTISAYMQAMRIPHNQSNNLTMHCVCKSINPFFLVIERNV